MTANESTEMWRALRKDVQQHRAKMLKQADTTGWTKHTDYHYSRIFAGKRFDWWPSGGKGMYDECMIYGHRKVNSSIAKLIAQETSHD